MRLQYASRDHRLVRMFHDDGRVEVFPVDHFEIVRRVEGDYAGDVCMTPPIAIEPEPDDADMLLNEPRRRAQAEPLTPDPITWDELEASVTPQAEEVKPAEGDIHADEYDLHEDEPEPTPLSIDDLISSGTMLTEDEYAMRVGILSGKVEQYAQQRIASRYDANARADIQKDFQTYIHKGALGLPITPAEDAAYQRANEKNAWIHAQETHARQLRESLPTLPLAMLRAYKLEDAGWPE